MYQALYRKYRPKSFDDVVGQAHITRTLQNEVTARIHRTEIPAGSVKFAGE